MRKNLMVLPMSLVLSATFLTGCGKDIDTDMKAADQETTIGSSVMEETRDLEQIKKIFGEYDQEFYRRYGSPFRGYTFEKLFNDYLRCPVALARKEVTSYEYDTPYVTTYEYGDGKLLRVLCRGDLTEYTYSGDKLIQERFTYEDYELLTKYSYEGDHLVNDETRKNGEWFASYEFSYDGDRITCIRSDYAEGGNGEKHLIYENGLLMKKDHYDDNGDLKVDTQNLYDEKGNTVKIIQYSYSEGLENLAWEYTYDENGFAIHVKEGYCDEEGNIVSVSFEGNIEYRYDDELMQSMSGTTYLKDSSFDTYTECIFDKDGRIVSYKSNYPDGRDVAYSYEYILDDNDRLKQSIKTNEITGSLEETVDYYYYD